MAGPKTEAGASKNFQTADTHSRHHRDHEIHICSHCVSVFCHVLSCSSLHTALAATAALVLGLKSNQWRSTFAILVSLAEKVHSNRCNVDVGSDRRRLPRLFAAMRTLRLKLHPSGVAENHIFTVHDAKKKKPLDGSNTAVQTNTRSSVPTVGDGVCTNTKNCTPLEPRHCMAQDSNIYQPDQTPKLLSGSTIGVSVDIFAQVRL